MKTAQYSFALLDGDHCEAPRISAVGQSDEVLQHIDQLNAQRKTTLTAASAFIAQAIGNISDNQFSHAAPNAFVLPPAQLPTPQEITRVTESTPSLLPKKAYEADTEVATSTGLKMYFPRLEKVNEAFAETGVRAANTASEIPREAAVKSDVAGEAKANDTEFAYTHDTFKIIEPSLATAEIPVLAETGPPYVKELSIAGGTFVLAGVAAVMVSKLVPRKSHAPVPSQKVSQQRFFERFRRSTRVTGLITA